MELRNTKVTISVHMKRYIALVKTTLLAILTISVMSCANEQPPSGGPPDKEPPRALSFEPVQMTKNFTGDKVMIEFSEYVQKSTVAENIFITPRIPFELDWSGRYIDIKFTQPLESNTTYTVSLGADYTDLKGNKPTESFALTFSTGINIDSGTINGKIYELSPSGIYVFLYPLGAINADTLNPSRTEPRYITQTGSSGDFTFHALPDGEYRLIAVRDQYKDRLFSLGTDGFGTTWKKVTVNKSKSPLVVLRCGEPKDIVEPALYNVDAKSTTHILLEFSEELDTNSIHPDMFMITDTSDTNTKRQFSFVYANSKNSKTLTGILPAILDTSKVWQLVCNNELKDKFGNKIQDSLRSKLFRASIERDTSNPSIEYISLRDSSKNSVLSAQMNVQFSTAMDTNSVMRSITLTDPQNSKSQALLFNWKSSKELVVTSETLLRSYQWYEYQIDHKNIRAWNGRLINDSNRQIRFRTIDTREFGTIKGELIDSAIVSGGQYILLITPKNTKLQTTPYHINLTKPGTWLKDNLPPGDYIIGVFHDANNNGVYDFGTSFPYSFAERFSIKPITVTVKSRWILEGITVVLQP